MPPSWPQLRYSLYAPIYDLFAGRFARQRQRSLRLAGPGVQDRVLLVGAGTGLDLPELRACGEVLATDISPAMLARLSRRAARLGMTVKAQVMDAEALDAPDGHYTLVVLHLILAVVDDPIRTLREVERVLAPGGRVAVFDKFLPDGASPPGWRRALNVPLRWLATDINRRFADIVRYTQLRVAHDEPALWGGTFRVIQLVKPSDSAHHARS